MDPSSEHHLTWISLYWPQLGQVLGILNHCGMLVIWNRANFWTIMFKTILASLNSSNYKMQSGAIGSFCSQIHQAPLRRERTHFVFAIIILITIYTKIKNATRDWNSHDRRFFSKDKRCNIENRVKFSQKSSNSIKNWVNKGVFSNNSYS